MKPSVSVDHLVSLVLRLVVSFEDARPAHANLPTRVRRVRRGVVHLRDVVELHLTARNRGSDVPAREISLVRLADDTCALRHAVSLEDNAAEAHAEKLHDLRGDRGGPRGHVPHPPAELVA